MNDERVDQSVDDARFVVPSSPRLATRRVLAGVVVAVCSLAVIVWASSRADGTVAEIVAITALPPTSTSARPLLPAPVVVGNQAALDFVWSSIGADDQAPKIDFGRPSSGDAPIVAVASVSDLGDGCFFAGATLAQAADLVGTDGLGVEQLTLERPPAQQCTEQTSGVDKRVAILVVEPRQWQEPDGQVRTFLLNVNGLGVILEQWREPPDISPIGSEFAVRWAMAHNPNLTSPEFAVTPVGVPFAQMWPTVGGQPGRTAWNPDHPRCGTVWPGVFPDGVHGLVGPNPMNDTGRVEAITITDSRYRTAANTGVGSTLDQLNERYEVDSANLGEILPAMVPFVADSLVAGAVATFTVALRTLSSDDGTTEFEGGIYHFWLNADDVAVALTISDGVFGPTVPTCAAWQAAVSG